MRDFLRSLTTSRRWLAMVLLALPGLVQAQTTITSFSPTSGPISTSVTFVGSGFNATATQNVVFFGATRAPVTAASATSLTAMVPLGTTYQYPTVTNLATKLTAYARQPFVVTLNGNVAFAPNVDFNVGPAPDAVAVVDVDDDGKPDLVTANAGTNTVSVLRNTSTAGTVSFAPNVDFTVGSMPKSVAIGDVDGDGKPDLVTANAGTNTVSVLRNTGTAGTVSFAPSANFSVGGAPQSVAIGDVDGDGKPDLVTVNNGTSTVAVLRNTSTAGTVSFAARVNFSVGGAPQSVAIGDVDGDGKPELVTANNGASTVSVLRNTAAVGVLTTGSFALSANFPVGVGPISVAIGDVDGDGKPELVAANNVANTVSVLRNTASAGGLTVGSFAPNVDFPVGSTPKSVAIGDVDGDGKPDVVTANNGANTASVLRNTASAGGLTAGSFGTTVDFTVGTGPFSVAIGDMDGDSKPDLVTSSDIANTVSVRLNQPPPPPTITSFSPTSGVAGTSVTLTGTSLTGATSVSVNGVAVTPTSVTPTSLVFAVPAGASATQSITVTTPVATSAPSTAFTVLLKVVSTSPAANARTASRANSATAVTFYEPVTAASAANLKVFSAQAGGKKTGTVGVSVNTANFTGTGPLAAFQAGEPVQVTVPATVVSAGNIPATPFAYQFFAAATGTGRGNFLGGTDVTVSNGGLAVGADVNSDGKPDLIVSSYINPGNLRVFLGNGTGTSFVEMTGSPFATGDVQPERVQTGDMNNDGRLDLVVGHRNGTTSTSIAVLLGTSGGSFAAATGSPFVVSNARFRGMALVDLNNDGFLDVASPDDVNGGVYVHLNNGTGALTTPTFSVCGTNTLVVATGDANSDGYLDLFAANYNTSNVTVLLNNGSGTSFSAATGSPFAVGTNPNGMNTGDFNNDGFVDFATSANTTGGLLSVWLGNGSGGFAQATGSPFAGGPRAQYQAVGDIDSDGNLDIVTADFAGTSIGVIRGLGNGTFSAPTFSAGSANPNGIALADMDQDGDLDVLLTVGNTVNVRLNQAPAPTITSISPTPGVRGEAVTVTGTNLGSVTGVSVNGAAAMAASFVNNTATSLTFQVPATAAASGTTSFTTAGGTASTATFTTVAATPPGNALAFDGVDDFVPFGSTPAVSNLGLGSFTLEAWVYYDGGSGAESIIRKDGDYNFYLNGNTLHGEVWTGGTSSPAWQRIDASTTALPANRWAHVAAVWNGSTMQLFVNGALEASTTTTTNITVSANLTLGKSQVYGNLLTGRLDEVRIYTAALTPANIQADMRNTASAVPASLKLYLDFDQGTGGGTNTGQTTLYDQSSNAYAGTPTNFALTGSASNYVESYALVVPTATAATAITGTGFTANWTAPALGTVDNGYRVDVSTSSTFASVISGSPFTAASGLSLAITGLAYSTTYYYRVRADKTSVTGQGGVSNTISLTTLPPVPTITSFNPTSGVAGTSVTLTGTGLTGATSVSVNGVAVTPTSVTATSLTFVVPAGASATQSITVTTPGGTSAASTAFTVLLKVASTSPAANAITAPLASSATAVTFTEPVTAASAANLKVFSGQLGGLKAGTVTVAGSTASFAATASTVRTNFKPGETVSVTVPATVANANGLTSAKRVYQFTTATGGTGRGNFLPGSSLAVPQQPHGLAVGDVDGDGDLDYVTANTYANNANVRLNNGSGTFSGTQVVSVGASPNDAALADVDGDGDLDLLTANGTSSPAGNVSIRLNDGTGTFANGSDITVGINATSIVTADLDGDGDLDFAVANLYSGTVSVRFNNGSGTFSGTQEVPVNSRPQGLALGDIDGDGDIDLLVGGVFGTVANVRLNDGNGNFSSAPDLTVGTGPLAVALGDVNGDGALDALTVNNNNNTVSVRLNNGSGTFTGTQQVSIGNYPFNLALGDVDADGDLDVVTANYSGNSSSIRLNDGAGNFSGSADPAVGSSPYRVALADVDGDGDLDLLTPNNFGKAVGVLLNQPPATLTAVSPTAELPGTPVTLTGTNFAAGSTVSFGGTAGTGVTFNSATSLTVTVPAGLAAGSAPIVVTAGGGPSAALPFTALAVYDGGTLDACTAAVPATASLNDGAWHYLLSSGGQVVAAYNYTGASLGNLTIEVLRANPAAAVRQDSHNHYYLDRNFHLTASAGPFTGRTVSMRFYGLNTELARLQAADATVTLANLKTTQYSGPNEDCDLGNDLASGEHRTLAAPANTPAGAPWFVAQVAVADHFSEFFLTGSSAPLPVELSAFTATAEGTTAVRLAWATASEKNSARFEVERSADGRVFAAIGTVAAAGSSAAPRAYALTDARLPADAVTLYYRLRQVDLDGTFAYSPLRSVALGGKGAAPARLLAYPNPAHDAVRVLLLNTAAGAPLQVVDALGRVVRSQPAPAAGTETVLPLGGLPTGIFVLRCGALSQRLTVE